MFRKLIVINGVAANGKDSFVKFVDFYFPGPVVNHSTVDTVKKAGKLFGSDEAVAKTDADRRLWSDLKDAYTRYCNGPFKEIVKLVGELKNEITDAPIIMFAHIREPEELQKVKDEFGDECITLLVTGLNDHIPDNHADQNVMNYCYDIIIKNDSGIDQLENTAKKFVQSLI